MKLTVKAPVTKNGYSRCITFDTEKKTFYWDYSPYSWDLKVTSKKELNNLEKTLKLEGYKAVIRL